jgi:hypothetical protein
VTQLSRFGFTVNIPAGWEGEFVAHPSGHIVLHVMNGPLPPNRSDFGGHGIEFIPSGRIFIAILEYASSDASIGLYSRQGLPTFVPSDFAVNHLHRSFPGQIGAQKFFTYQDRSMCCYVVLASTTAPPAMVGEVNRVLGSMGATSYV